MVGIDVNYTIGIHVAEMVKIPGKCPSIRPRPLVFVMKGVLAQSGFNVPAYRNLGIYAIVSNRISLLQVGAIQQSHTVC